MTRRHVLSFVLVALISASFAIAAEGEGEKEAPRKGRGGPGGGLDQALAKLDLSDEQKKTIEDAKTTLKAAMEKAREDKDREAARAAHGKFRETVLGALTDAQKEQLRKAMQEGRDGDRKRGDRKPGERKERKERGEKSEN